jgi:hypothetical protein
VGNLPPDVRQESIFANGLKLSVRAQYVEPGAWQIPDLGFFTERARLSLTADGGLLLRWPLRQPDGSITLFDDHKPIPVNLALASRFISEVSRRYFR